MLRTYKNYSSYIHITKQVLHYRRLKQVQSELTEDVLNLKRLDLEEASCKQDESNKSKLGQSPTPKLGQDEKYEDDIKSIEDRFVEISKEYASNKRLITEQDDHEYQNAHACLTLASQSKIW